MANLQRFEESPELAWGFYGHRLQLYRDTVPHEGFQTLRGWAGRMRRGAFVFTSNVDGQFQKAGFAENRIHEVHGTIHQLQCISACRQVTWPADDFTPVVNPETSRLVNALPHCPHCSRLARPNILLFWDATWVEHNADTQEARLRAWLASVPRLVVVELGAGNPPCVTQVKEKLGGLRVYFAGPQSDEVNALVAAAERRSKSVCELCGQPGGLVWHSRYLRSRCDGCDAEEGGPQR
ncbi:SIR2 family NAD-dependent protein deacylase [Caballeronia glebae]|uniref:SIR2 family NAD-dependent protein deacylase n=1 Tax=Caballeronia glebae TaxID=1777143 RepID=UPI0038BDFACE